MADNSPRELILANLKERSSHKQDVFQKTREVFAVFKHELNEVIEDLSNEMEEHDHRIKIDLSGHGEFEAEAKIAGDVLIFHMHTNVFQFDQGHDMWKDPYVRKDNLRAYCGMINVYNFLADSIKYNRVLDSGYLVARIFVNSEGQFFVEGKRQLGYLYNHFGKEEITKEKIRDIIESVILYTLSFDLLTPSYDTMKEVTVNQMKELTNHASFKTGKRLGFQFEVDSDRPE